ncbi:hypothetical protein SD457_22370 [Coprobacillaceae bacterium CR2/5/TPMF4]|nr:hypothetical protein SD457_22370 [Coprobacillaceae bacterium CR2/5/TPMF4]
MSTSILKFRLMNEFKRHGYQVLLAAVPISELDDYIADAHIILLAPQVRFFEKELKSQYLYQYMLLILQIMEEWMLLKYFQKLKNI